MRQLIIPKELRSYLLPSGINPFSQKRKLIGNKLKPEIIFMNKKLLHHIKSKYPLYEDSLIADLQDPKEAAAYLEGSLEVFQEDGNQDALLLALNHLARARGGLATLAKKTSLNRQTLYKTLSSSGNPRLKTFGAIVNALGFRLTVAHKANY